MPSIIYLIHDYLGHHLINQSENKKKYCGVCMRWGPGGPATTRVATYSLPPRTTTVFTLLIVRKTHSRMFLMRIRSSCSFNTHKNFARDIALM